VANFVDFVIHQSQNILVRFVVKSLYNRINSVKDVCFLPQTKIGAVFLQHKFFT